MPTQGLPGAELSAVIAEEIFGWRVDHARGLCTDQDGNMFTIPDFPIPRDNQLLCTRMRDQGFSLEVVRDQGDWEEERGVSHRARFARSGQQFEAIHPDKGLAICFAALRAFGFPVESAE